MSDEQIVDLLQEADMGEELINALCREDNISEPTFYAWRKKFGGVSTKEVQRLRELKKRTPVSRSCSLTATCRSTASKG